MLLAALLAAAAPDPHSVLEADRALAAQVRSDGQWTAFRRFAEADAIMFHNGAHPAAALLKGQPDPATPLTWTVEESWTSCDGTTAFTVGPVRRPSGKAGMLLLVWRKQPDGSWKWVAWRGAAEGRAELPGPRVEAASCEGSPPSYLMPKAEGPSGRLWSPDRTLLWDWRTDAAGKVSYSVRAWDGTRHVTLIAGGDEVRVGGR